MRDRRQKRGSATLSIRKTRTRATSRRARDRVAGYVVVKRRWVVLVQPEEKSPRVCRLLYVRTKGLRTSVVVKGLLDSGELLLRRPPAELTRKGVEIYHLCSLIMHHAPLLPFIRLRYISAILDINYHLKVCDVILTFFSKEFCIISFDTRYEKS